MRGAILFGVFMFIATLAGGYGITWYAQARATKQAIEQVVANINQGSKTPLLTYEKLETSGFPSTVNVTMLHPHFSGQMDEIFKQMADNASKNGATGHIPPYLQKPWQQTIDFDGRIIFSVSALSDHYTMQVIGNSTGTAKIGDKTFTTTSSQSGATFCSLQLERNTSLLSSLWNYETLARDSAQLLRDLRLFDCAIPSLSTAKDGQTLASTGPIRFYVSNAPMGDTQHLRIYLNATDLEVTEAGDTYSTEFFAALDPSQGYPRHLASYGKQVLDIDFSYNGPSSLPETPNPTFDIALGKFDISSAIYKSHFALFVNNAFDGQKNHSKLTLRGDSSFAPEYDTLLHDVIRALIEEAYTSSDPRFMEFQATMHQYTPEQMYAIVSPVIPNLNSMGNIVQSVDLEYNGDTDFNEGEATLHDLEFSTTPYGIKGNGIAKREKGGQPIGQLALTCTNCASMIDDIFNYMLRLNTAVRYFNPNQATAMTQNPQLPDAIKTYLMRLAGPDKVNWTYDIQSTPEKGVIINGKTLNTVLQMYNEYVMPLMKKAQNPPPPSTH